MFVCNITFKGNERKQKYRIRELSEKEDNIYQKMQCFATRLFLETYEILLHETCGKSEETSLCLIFSTFVSLSGLAFKSTQICQKIYVFCKKISTFFDVKRKLVMIVKFFGSVTVLFLVNFYLVVTFI